MKAVYDLARAEIGTWEWAEGSNPKIDAYFADVGYPTQRDDTAWCAAFAGSMLKRAGLPHTGKLNARSYLDWGQPVEINGAQPGDIVVFWRGSKNSWTGHVAFFARRDGDNIIVVGGNQRDQVSEASYPAARILGVRRMARKSRAKSTTLQASATQVVAGTGTAVAAIGGLDGAAQLVAIGGAVLVVLAALWIMRERLKKWASGDR